MKGKWSFLLFCGLAFFPVRPAWGRQQVFIQPLDRVEQAVLEKVSGSLASFFDLEVKIVPEIALPAAAYYAPRKRYRADKLLDFLDSLESASRGRIIGITQKDISVTKGDIPDWGIFGLGFAPGRVCIVSTFRLKRGRTTRTLFLRRLEQVAVHELAHTFGLLHCPSPRCLMEDARGTIRSVDQSTGLFCARCRKQLGVLLKNR
jgi:archaemetzincin